MTSSMSERSSSEENLTFLELKPAKSVSLIEVRPIGKSPRYGTRKSCCHQLTKIRLIAALSVVTLLVAVSIILYFAIMHYIATTQLSGSTETDITSVTPPQSTTTFSATSEDVTSYVTTKHNPTQIITTVVQPISTQSSFTTITEGVGVTESRKEKKTDVITTTDITSVAPPQNTTTISTTNGEVTSYETTKHNPTQIITTVTEPISTHQSTFTAITDGVGVTESTKETKTAVITSTEEHTDASQTTTGRNNVSDAPNFTTTDQVIEETSPNLTTTKPELVTEVITEVTTKAVKKENHTVAIQTTTEINNVSDSRNFTATEQVINKTWPNLTTTKPGLVTKVITEVTTEAVKKVPIVYVPGRFTFTQAQEACEKMGTTIAFKDDLQHAYEAGYERCIWGWLGDLHQGFVIQKSGARMGCGRGAWGVIYSKSYIDVNSVEKGVYCKTTPDKPTPEPAALEMTQKSVNWWVRLDPADIYNLRSLLDFSWQNPVTKQPDDTSPSNLLGSVHAVYPCCNFFNITWQADGKENRTYVALKRSLESMKYLAAEYRRQFSDVQISILPHVAASYEAMMLYGAATTNRSQIIDDLVEKAATAGLDGVIIDYEPPKEYTREHAMVYRDFMNDLDIKMKTNNMEVGMMVSGWGILKFYDIYSTVKCRMIGSMASTYSGRDVQRNINNVDEMLLHIATQRLQVGIGSMHDEEMAKPRRDFDWTPNELNQFLQHLTKVDVQHLHIFPGNWEAIKWTEDFFMNSLLEFVRT